MEKRAQTAFSISRRRLTVTVTLPATEKWSIKDLSHHNPTSLSVSFPFNGEAFLTVQVSSTLPPSAARDGDPPAGAEELDSVKRRPSAPGRDRDRDSGD
jgi:hypothetical protein